MLMRHERDVLGPYGLPLTPTELPPQNTRRWVVGQKAKVVLALQHGLLTLDEACCRYALTIEEICSWQRAYARYGLVGLHATARPKPSATQIPKFP